MFSVMLNNYTPTDRIRSMKTRKPETATAIKIEELKAFRAELLRFQSVVESSIQVAENVEQKAICAFNYASGIVGIERLSTFIEELTKSVFEASRGKPIVEGQLKSRSTAKKLPSAGTVKARIKKKAQ